MNSMDARIAQLETQLTEGDGFLARAMEADVLSVHYEERLGLLNETSLSPGLWEGTVATKIRQLSK
jgi:hypothetical protein